MIALYYSDASPFARKVRIALDLLGLVDRVELKVVDTGSPSAEYLRRAPLGKVPMLQIAGDCLYDSRVIIEYLDMLAGGALFPDGSARFDALTQQALADGLLDACLLQVYEVRFRPVERRVPYWIERQRNKVDRALAVAEDRFSGPIGSIHIGHVAQACALGYLDLRFNGQWRAHYPALVAWLYQFSETVPAYQGTACSV